MERQRETGLDMQHHPQNVRGVCLLQRRFRNKTSLLVGIHGRPIFALNAQVNTPDLPMKLQPRATGRKYLGKNPLSTKCGISDQYPQFRMPLVAKHGLVLDIADMKLVGL